MASQAVDQNDTGCGQPKLAKDPEGNNLLEVDVGAVIWIIDHAQSSGLDILPRDLHRGMREIRKDHSTELSRALLDPGLIVDKASYEQHTVFS